MDNKSTLIINSNMYTMFNMEALISKDNNVNNFYKY